MTIVTTYGKQEIESFSKDSQLKEFIYSALQGTEGFQAKVQVDPPSGPSIFSNPKEKYEKQLAIVIADMRELERLESVNAPNEKQLYKKRVNLIKDLQQLTELANKTNLSIRRNHATTQALQDKAEALLQGYKTPPRRPSPSKDPSVASPAPRITKQELQTAAIAQCKEIIARFWDDQIDSFTARAYLEEILPHIDSPIVVQRGDTVIQINPDLPGLFTFRRA